MNEIERAVSIAFGGSFNCSLVSTTEKSSCLLTYCPVFRKSAPSSCLHSILVKFLCNFCDGTFKVNPHWQPPQGLIFFKDIMVVAAQFSKQFNCVMIVLCSTHQVYLWNRKWWILPLWNYSLRKVKASSCISL